MDIVATDIADIDLIGALWEELNEHNNALHKKYFGEALSEKWIHKSRELIRRAAECRTKFDVVKIDDDIVGYCISGINKYSQGEIVSLYIRPGFRSTGAGTRLLTEHIRWLKENNVITIYLYVHPCNIDAIRFYWRFNFFATGPVMELFEPQV
jgi:diamine N-acetyltransferase